MLCAAADANVHWGPSHVGVVVVLLLVLVVASWLIHDGVTQVNSHPARLSCNMVGSVRKKKERWTVHPGRLLDRDSLSFHPRPCQP